METSDSPPEPVNKFAIPKLRLKTTASDASLSDFLSNIKASRGTRAVLPNGIANGNAPPIVQDKKLIVPKLRTNSSANNSSITEYLSTIRTSKQAVSSQLFKSKDDVPAGNIYTHSGFNSTSHMKPSVINLMSSLKINEDNKYSEPKCSSAVCYDIDLTKALRSPANYRRPTPETTECATENDDIAFEKHFIDCDEEKTDADVTGYKLKCKIDLSEMRGYRSKLMARGCSAFGRVACGRFRPYDGPLSDFRAYTKLSGSVVPFDFKSLSPDDTVSLRFQPQN